MSDVRISPETVKNILKRSLIKSTNRDIIVEMLYKCLDDDQLNMCINMLLNTDRHELLIQEDLVKIELAKSWEIKDQVNKDKLSDLGLLKDGYVFGIIDNSDDYRSEFNPFHYKLKVASYIHDKEGNIIKKKIALYTRDLKKVKCKDIISYLKSIDTQL